MKVNRVERVPINQTDLMLIRFILLLLRFYKLAISPYLPSQCAYIPTCSEYAADAVKSRGAFKGAWMALKRLARCNPFAAGGYDPVPDTYDK